MSQLPPRELAAFTDTTFWDLDLARYVAGEPLPARPHPSGHRATHVLFPAASASPPTLHTPPTPHPTAHTSQSPQHEQAEHARRAAEEEKRRRNTAASARFRIKKKQRDQELERRVREAGERAGELERRVRELETENRWLRELVVEKRRAGERAARE